MIRQVNYAVYIRPCETAGDLTIPHTNIYVTEHPRSIVTTPKYVQPIGDGWVLFGIADTKKAVHSLIRTVRSQFNLQDEHIVVEQIIPFDYIVKPWK